jgi:hypothetical protein
MHRDTKETPDRLSDNPAIWRRARRLAEAWPLCL